MMSTNRLRLLTATLLSIAILAGAAVLVRAAFFAPRTVTAHFVAATAIYPGDQVRVAGVKVGTIAAIEPQGAEIKMTLTVNHRVRIPADVKAVIVAQNLVSARYVQLTPAYRKSGPTLPDRKADIPIDRTAVPVEWDEVKTQLNRLATELGPAAGVSDTATARFINSSADALAGNGNKLRELRQQQIDA